MVDTAALKGVHHCIKSGILAAEAIYASLKRGESLEAYEQAVEDSSIGQELYQVRNTRQPFQKGFLLGGPLGGPAIMTKGKVPARPAGRGIATTPSRCSSATPTRSYPKPDGKYTFDKLSAASTSSGNATRDDAPNHIRVQPQRPARDRRGVALDVPGGGRTRSPTTRRQRARST